MMNNTDEELSRPNADFGSVLAVARKLNNYTVEQVSDQLKIPIKMITALESNDLVTLPAPTFTQGYIRAYAKYLEISEEKVITIYNVAVPHKQSSVLKPRSMLQKEANSQSPMVKAVTIFLLILGVIAILYGVINYYQEKSDVMATEIASKERSFTGNSLDSPGSQKLVIKQNARLSNDGELLVIKDKTTSVLAAEIEAMKVETTETTIAAVEESQLTKKQVAVEEIKAVIKVTEKSAELKLSDELKIYAEKGAWISIRDARNKRLLYNMVPVEGSKVLKGLAPFRVSLGNAQSTSMVMNGVVLDISGHMQENNTAKFTVSTNQGAAVFH